MVGLWQRPSVTGQETMRDTPTRARTLAHEAAGPAGKKHIPQRGSSEAGI